MAVDLSTSKSTEIQRLLGFQVGLSLFELRWRVEQRSVCFWNLIDFQRRERRTFQMKCFERGNCYSDWCRNRWEWSSDKSDDNDGDDGGDDLRQVLFSIWTFWLSVPSKAHRRCEGGSFLPVLKTMNSNPAVAADECLSQVGVHQYHVQILSRFPATTN